jgi:hypothetical protein
MLPERLANVDLACLYEIDCDQGSSIIRTSCASGSRHPCEVNDEVADGAVTESSQRESRIFDQ